MGPILRTQPAGVTLHLVQRGYAGARCFFCARDRIAYLDLLREQASLGACAVHAYVLMANHVHLLVTPARANAGARLMRVLAQRYAPLPAAPDGGAGRLWERDCEAVPVYARRYVLGCMRYIELNPVRARLVARPEAYRWSSHRANALGEEDALLSPHPLYCALGRSPQERRAAYRAQFRRA